MSNLAMSRGCCGNHRRWGAVVACPPCFLCKSWFESGFLAQLDRARDRKTRECLAGRQRPHPHVELGHADPMPSLEGACQDSLYSDLLSFLLSLCTREHDTHLML